MLTALLATSTSALFGVADFLGGMASRRESAFAVTAAAHAVGVVLFVLALFIFPSPFSTEAVVAGIAAGVSGGIGVVSLYAALARGRMSVVAPLTAALSGSLPALYDLARGSQLSTTSVVGLVLALAATVIVSATSGDGGDGTPQMPASAIVLSLVAGVGFAGSFIAFSLAGQETGFWPLASARITSFAMLASVTFARRGTLAIDPSVRRAVLATGALDAMANVTMLTAIRIGPLAVASVLGSLYPVVTVLLARVVLKERLKGLQRVGVAIAFVAVLLTAWPS
jgi:uncharacterized membrane protein